MAPKVADRLSRLRITALIGITTEPNWMNSTRKVTRAMIPAARGKPREQRRLRVDELCRHARDLGGERRRSVARMAFTRASPSLESGSTAGTTDRYVLPPALALLKAR